MSWKLDVSRAISFDGSLVFVVCPPSRRRSVASCFSAALHESGRPGTHPVVSVSIPPLPPRTSLLFSLPPTRLRLFSAGRHTHPILAQLPAGDHTPSSVNIAVSAPINEYLRSVSGSSTPSDTKRTFHLFRYGRSRGWADFWSGVIGKRISQS